tara:strand:- start:724 stop:1287 length:564 start_codon:yes stop_codon:yes gene_type:complete
MASNIVPGNIDGAYPKAGQDNSSQGFRDNFSAIKDNFTEAKNDIEALQTNKASLNASSDFANNEVTRAVFKNTSDQVFAHGSVGGGAITLNFANGHYQTATITANTTFSFVNFPSTNVGRMTLDLTVQPTSTGVLTFPSAVIKSSNVGGSDGTSDTVTAGLGRVLYEFVSPDAGTTILMHELGRQYT